VLLVFAGPASASDADVAELLSELCPPGALPPLPLPTEREARLRAAWSKVDVRWRADQQPADLWARGRLATCLGESESAAADLLRASVLAPDGLTAGDRRAVWSGPVGAVPRARSLLAPGVAVASLSGLTSLGFGIASGANLQSARWNDRWLTESCLDVDEEWCEDDLNYYRAHGDQLRSRGTGAVLVAAGTAATSVALSVLTGLQNRQFRLRYGLVVLPTPAGVQVAGRF